jgi:hypothetical protein
LSEPLRPQPDRRVLKLDPSVTGDERQLALAASEDLTAVDIRARAEPAGP